MESSGGMAAVVQVTLNSLQTFQINFRTHLFACHFWMSVFLNMKSVKMALMSWCVQFFSTGFVDSVG